MQWSKIKTLFILCFLVLNVYLLYQFMQKQDVTDLEVLENQEASIEDRLEAENITVGDIDMEEKEEPYISVKPKTFTEEERNQISNLENQESAVIADNFLVSYLEDPVSVPEDATAQGIYSIVGPYLLYPEEYEFWEWDEELNALIFFQQKNDRPVYFNQSAVLLVFLNEENEMIFYTQTMLGEAETQTSNRSVKQPRQAIEVLLDWNELYSGDEVTHVDIGYMTRMPLPDGDQVFAPTYNITVENDSEERNYLFNALEGLPSPQDEKEFYEESIMNSITNISALNDENEIKEPVLQILNQKLGEENRSESQ
ncbi:two-component system regulatory protein YycI [Virgibacillus ainsalahensis]